MDFRATIIVEDLHIDQINPRLCLEKVEEDSNSNKLDNERFRAAPWYALSPIRRARYCCPSLESRPSTTVHFAQSDRKLCHDSKLYCFDILIPDCCRLLFLDSMCHTVQIIWRSTDLPSELFGRLTTLARGHNPNLQFQI